ncbi:hypothetical protein Agabi119p4_7795 [Agaricus bisporus var. burnettii]|uniref:Uncharacterized protein n=1 Tax=Agaricus bisporus var. burnettii TaxID=192524 RepID=A0A8H7C7S5_AGABI|nr:hypothetical protein Agabi119p4_7795 [Agaricus bisporus var. burnettii]
MNKGSPSIIAQEPDLQELFTGESVEGTVELDAEKVEGVDRVEVKITGRLKLNEIAEGGTSSANLALDTKLLWAKSPSSQQCPQKLDFDLMLPTTFTYEGTTYPLPPTYSVKLKGLPGFTASIEYSVAALVNRPSTVPSMVPLVKSKTLGIHIGTTVVTTPFLYHPSTRPSGPLPPALVWSRLQGFGLTPEWRIFETISTAKKSHLQDVVIKLLIPKSRVFALKQIIPFYVTFESSDASLSAFLPFAPSNGSSSNKTTKIEIVRQATVDTSNEADTDARKDMWRIDSIGQGTFSHMANEKRVSVFSGELAISDAIQVGGFRAAGLFVKDCIVLSMSPMNPGKCPFMDFRLAVPIRLVSSPWAADGTGIGARDARRSQEEPGNLDVKSS